MVAGLREALGLSTQAMYASVPTSSEPAQQRTRMPHDESHFGAEIALEGCTILFFGSESLALTNLLVTHGSSEVSSHIYVLSFNLSYDTRYTAMTQKLKAL